MASPLKPTVDNITGPKCPNNRYLIDDLAPVLHQIYPQFPASDYAALLNLRNNEPKSLVQFFQMGVTSPNDDGVTFLEKQQGFLSAKTSISAGEAYSFFASVCKFKEGACSLNLSGIEGDIRAVTAAGLFKIFFPGYAPREEKICTPGYTPPKVVTPINIYRDKKKPDAKHCHDGDTCKISVEVPEQCHAQGYLGFFGSERTSLTDAPEVGEINPKWKPFIIKLIHNPDSNEYPGEMQYKRKLIQAALRAYGLYVTDKKVSDEEAYAAVMAMATWVDYTGQISANIMNDFVMYAQEEKRAQFYTGESTIRWTSSDTPAQMCGLWQPFDTYMRRLITFMIDDQRHINNYLETELPKTVVESDGLHAIYMAKLEQQLAPLAKSANKQMRDLYKLISADALPKASDYYSPEKIAAMRTAYAAFIEKHPNAKKDWSLAQVYLGAVLAYMKYLTPDGETYEAAMKDAQEIGIGFWDKRDPVFGPLWNLSQQDPRYHPEDCMKKACGSASAEPVQPTSFLASIISWLQSDRPGLLVSRLYSQGLPS